MLTLFYVRKSRRCLHRTHLRSHRSRAEHPGIRSRERGAARRPGCSSDAPKMRRSGRFVCWLQARESNPVFRDYEPGGLPDALPATSR